MPLLKNPRHERFAQLLAGAKSAAEAFFAAANTGMPAFGVSLCCRPRFCGGRAL
jgi:hypothetical protein